MARSRKGSLVLSKAFEGFVLARTAGGHSPHTIDIYRWAWKRLLDRVGDKPVEQVTAAELTGFIAWLQTDYKPQRPAGDTTPLTPQSVTHAWSTIRSFFNWYSDEFKYTKRPDDNLPRPKVQAPEVTPFTEAEIKRILRAAERTREAGTERRKPFAMTRPTARRDVALILLLLDTGLRASEVTRLRIRDINMDTGEVFVKPWGSGQKTKSRHVYLGKAARRALWRYLTSREYTPEDPVFLSKSDRELDRDAMRHVLTEIGQHADVPKCHPHRFRHTFAVQYLLNGGDAFMLQKLMGHSSLEMVKRYLYFSQADIMARHYTSSPADRWHL